MLPLATALGAPAELFALALKESAKASTPASGAQRPLPSHAWVPSSPTSLPSAAAALSVVKGQLLPAHQPWAAVSRQSRCYRHNRSQALQRSYGGWLLRQLAVSGRVPSHCCKLRGASGGRKVSTGAALSLVQASCAGCFIRGHPNPTRALR